MLHHISTTEFLNYEDDKFSKTRGTGVFGDDAKNTGIPSEVWRYYLLANRPEASDTQFKWTDFQAKNNTELLNNVGNFSNRCLAFIAGKYEKKIPSKAAGLTEFDIKYLTDLKNLVNTYVEQMEGVKLKSGLQTAMLASALGNEYIQLSNGFKLFKTEPERAATIYNVIANILVVVTVLLEPFIPGFSAKIWTLMKVERTERQEKFLEEIFNATPEGLSDLIPEGHEIDDPKVIFRAISDEQVEAWKVQFGKKE